MALLAISLLLGFVTLPLWARPLDSHSTAARCLSNFRRLAVAWQLYATDHNGRLVQNFHGGDAFGGAAASNPRYAPWVSGWLSWGTESDNTNLLFLREPKWARLGPYISTPNNVHKCPADIYLSYAQRGKAWTQRARSVSMNGTLGHANFRGNRGPLSTRYAIALTLSDLRFPGPAQSTVFLDEHPDSLNDPLFFPPGSNAWIDLPGNLHTGGAAVSFADGHVEIHKWLTPLRSARVTLSGPSSLLGDLQPDIDWMSYHSQRTSAQGL